MMMGIAISLTGRLLGGAFSPQSLFPNAEPGVWYDPSDLTTMFQDRAGTTLVTTPGQSVGLVLDKRLGLTPGPELVTNGTFDTNTSGWTLGSSGGASIAHGSGEALVTNTGSSFGRGYVQTLTLTVGQTYKVSGSLRRTAGSGSATVAAMNNAEASILDQSVAVTSSTTTPVDFVFTATEANNKVYMRVVGASTTFAFDNISVREIPGNHMVATADASRGTYGIEPFGGRRNLLTFTEQFDNAAWTKFGNATIVVNQDAAPDGTLTADLYNNGVSLSTTALASASNTVLANTNYTFSLYAKRVSGAGWLAVIFRDTDSNNQFITWFDLNSGVVGSLGSASGRTTRETQSIQAVGDYYRISVSGRTSGTALTPLLFLATADGGAVRETNAQAYLWGAQLELGSTATPYQRVTTAFDVTEAGVPTVHYVQFDGADDGYLTSTITPGTDKAQVFAGVRKLSDVAIGMLVETSVNSGGNNGALAVTAPAGAGSASYLFQSRGTAIQQAIYTNAAVASPTTNVLTGLGDIAGDLATLRVNGTQVAQSTADQGTGNYLAYPLYIGRRGGTTLPFNGRLYQMVVRFGPNLDTARIQQVERYMAQKTGVTL